MTKKHQGYSEARGVERKESEATAWNGKGQTSGEAKGKTLEEAKGKLVGEAKGKPLDEVTKPNSKKHDDRSDFSVKALGAHSNLPPSSTPTSRTPCTSSSSFRAFAGQHDTAKDPRRMEVGKHVPKMTKKHSRKGHRRNRSLRSSIYPPAGLSDDDEIMKKAPSMVKPIWEALDMSLKLVELEAKKRIHRKVPSRSTTPPPLRGGSPVGSRSNLKLYQASVRLPSRHTRHHHHDHLQRKQFALPHTSHSRTRRGSEFLPSAEPHAAPPVDGLVHSLPGAADSSSISADAPAMADLESPSLRVTTTSTSSEFDLNLNSNLNFISTDTPAVVDLDLSGTSSSELPVKEAPQSLLAEALAEIDLGAHDKEIAPVLDLPSSAHLKHSSFSEDSLWTYSKEAILHTVCRRMQAIMQPVYQRERKEPAKSGAKLLKFATIRKGMRGIWETAEKDQEILMARELWVDKSSGVMGRSGSLQNKDSAGAAAAAAAAELGLGGGGGGSASFNKAEQATGKAFLKCKNIACVFEKAAEALLAVYRECAKEASTALTHIKKTVKQTSEKAVLIGGTEMSNFEEDGHRLEELMLEGEKMRLLVRSWISKFEKGADDKKAEWRESKLAKKVSIERSETATSTSSFDEVTVTLLADEPPDHTAGFREVLYALSDQMVRMALYTYELASEVLAASNLQLRELGPSYTAAGKDRKIADTFPQTFFYRRNHNHSLVHWVTLLVLMVHSVVSNSFPDQCPELVDAWWEFSATSMMSVGTILQRCTSSAGEEEEEDDHILVDLISLHDKEDEGGNEAEIAVRDANERLWNAQAIASCGRAVEISQELFYLTKAMVLAMPELLTAEMEALDGHGQPMVTDITELHYKMAHFMTTCVASWRCHLKMLHLRELNELQNVAAQTVMHVRNVDQSGILDRFMESSMYQDMLHNTNKVVNVMTKAMILSTDRREHGEKDESETDEVEASAAGSESIFVLGGSEPTLRPPVHSQQESDQPSTSGRAKDPWEGFTDCEWPMIIKKIGDGSFAQAWVAKWHMANVAVKIMKLDLDTFRPEFNFNCMLHHPNVVRFLGAAVNNQIGQTALIMELCENQSLCRLIEKANPVPTQLPWSRRLALAFDASCGMVYLHARGVLHNDFKSSNLLIDRAWRCKVCDFGMSKILGLEDPDHTPHSPQWMAPEVLRGEHYSFSADVFSFGVVLWELATLQLPWDQYEQLAVMHLVSNGNTLKYEPPQDPTGDLTPPPRYIELMEQCLSPEPENRPTFKEVAVTLGALRKRRIS